MSAQRTRLTTEQLEEVKQIVLSCILANRSINETIDIINRRLNLKLAVDTIKHLRMKVRKEALGELKAMQMDNQTYLYEFLKNMHQIKKVIKETWNLADLALQNNDCELRRKCLSDIANYTVSLNKFQDFLPAVCSMKLFDNDLVPTTSANTNTNWTFSRVSLYEQLMNQYEMVLVRWLVCQV